MRISDWSSEVCSSDLTSAEIDIVEYYGRRPDIYMSSSHVWRKSAPPTSVTRPTTAPWKGALEEGFNTYGVLIRSEEHTSELQSLMRISYAVFCLKKKQKTTSARNTR